ncbi:P-loop containing nucleoside triphosphate hydrolase protein [Neurospora tetraspora]|uniref:P-loop containing nucleoside triphosphate hydrolase protein n=1 Tax=Neurospora tetraspora TaxID=94610 RepID=A0AAE0JG74_9PEZI|nr:P-loop containing nucleoside triphosphate hydrolase protein [Neurospora tetraspora]
MLDPNQKAVVIGISGCSSSGKTTLARLLRDIFPNTFILHEDDFYKPESEIPMKDGLANWDCPEALSIPDMTAALEHIRATGELPVSNILTRPFLSRRHNRGCCYPPPPLSSTETKITAPKQGPGKIVKSKPLTGTTPLSPKKQATLDSKEDLNSIGPCPLTTDFINTIKSRVADWLQPSSPGHRILHLSSQQPLKICILDGFLLYSPPPLLPATLLSQMDIKLFLLVSKARALQRREARDGYVTLEGFWKDPPGYVEKIVWPEYVRAHEWMFEEGGVEGGKVKAEEVRERLGVLVNQKQGESKMDRDFGETLEWAVETIMRELEALVLGGEQRKDGDKENGDGEKEKEKEAIALNSFAMKKKWAAGQRERNARELLIKESQEQQQQQQKE